MSIERTKRYLHKEMARRYGHGSWTQKEIIDDCVNHMAEKNKVLIDALKSLLSPDFNPQDEIVKKLMLMTNPTKHCAVYKMREIAEQALKEYGHEAL